MKFGSLFAGIGGFDLGLERAGIATVWQVEKDAFRRAVLAKHFPHAKRYDDVRAVGAGNLESVDGVAGGFPCTDLSLAGRGAGIDGPESGLWAEYARIVGELRPRYVVVENVPALATRGLGRVLGDLAALGYDAEWDCLPASAFGAPHRRDRIWIVAYPKVESVGAGLRAGEPGGQRGRRSRNGGGPGDVADAARDAASRPETQPGPKRERARAGSERGGTRATDVGRPRDDTDVGRHRPPQEPIRPGRDGALDAGWWRTEPDVGRVADGIPSRVDRLSALGDALVPQIAEWIGRRILEYEES